MKLSILFILIAMFSTMFHHFSESPDPNYPSYSSDWDKVLELEQKGLIKDALLLCQNILKKALSEKNTPQVYKSLIYIETFNFQGNEEGLVGIIKNLESKLPTLDIVEKSLVQSVLGQLYWQHYSSTSRGGQSDTKSISEEQDSSDLNSWTSQSIINKSNEYYQASVSEAETLMQPIAWYRDIVFLGDDSLSKPTLFDILCQRAITHFEGQGSGGIYINHGLSASEVICNDVDFLKMDFSQNQHPLASVFSMYQHALRKHKKNGQAFFYLNHKRLQFGLQIFNDETSTQRFLEILTQYSKNTGNPEQAAIWHIDIANYYLEKSNFSLHTGLEQNIAYVREIKYHIEQAEKFGKSIKTIQKINALKKNIYQSSFSVDIEKVQLPSKPFRILVKYRNTKAVYFKLYKVSHELMYKRSFRNKEDYIEFIKKQKAIRSWKEECPDPGDHMEHAFETKIDALDLGAYFVIAGLDEKMDERKANVYCGFFQVSQLAPVIINGNAQARILYVMDRKSGTPVQKVGIALLSNEYDHWKNESEWKKIYSASTDNQGKHIFTSQNQGQLLLEYKKDRLWPESWISSFHHYAGDDYNETVVFTDRSLYRPGQTLHFKALLLKRDKSRYPTLLQIKKVKLDLINSNGQLVESKELTSNAYGSVHGHFILPSAGLLGDYYIQTGNGSMSFKVEEYKRPGFEVKFDTVKVSYKLNEKVNVPGHVLTFNQIPVSDASIRYRVYRQQVFPYYPCWYRWIPPVSQREEVAQGKSQTQSDGRFNIEFLAKARKSTGQNLDVSYEFVVEIDATDINGETQSGRHAMQISEKPFYLTTNLRAKQNIKDFEVLEIEALNNAGNNVLCQVQIQISKLKSPENWFRNRYWPKPDQFKLTKAEYNKLFPYDKYNNEDNPSFFPEEKKVLSQNLKIDKRYLLQNKNWLKESGTFKIQLIATDSKGEKIELVDYFEITETGKLNASSTPQLDVSQLSSQPGKTITYGLPKSTVPYSGIIILSRTQEAMIHQWHKSGGAFAKLTVQENDRGGFQLQSVTVFENCVFLSQAMIDVPWNNKKLEIVAESFRDKLLPGQAEKWKFKIIGLDSQAVQAEMLASMYDASLDKIFMHNWPMPDYPYFNNTAHVESPGFHHFTLMPYFTDYSADDAPGYESESYLNTFNLPMWGGYGDIMMYRSHAKGGMEPARSTRNEMPQEADAIVTSSTENKKEDVVQQIKNEALDIRKNFAENVFFYPNLSTDGKGSVSLEFVMSEALTRWKLQLFAHTLDLKFGSKTLELISFKPVQVSTYLPRFTRQGDQIVLKSKISNTTSEQVSGKLSIQILDLIGEKDITSDFLKNASQSVNLAVNENKSLNWNILIPANETRSLIIRTKFMSESYSDGEQQLLPVLPSRQFVTASLPLYVKGKSTADFKFEEFIKMSNSKTADIQNFTVELTSHPVWFAIQSLPYIADVPNECSDQLMTRIYANALSAHIMEKYPRVKQILTVAARSESFKSPLEQNKELKSALLEETPWLFDGMSETQQMKEIALLLDLNNMSMETSQGIQRLYDRQSSDGGFNWFPGGQNDPYISLQIIHMIGQLRKLNVKIVNNDRLSEIAKRSFTYLDQHLLNIYNNLEKEVKAGRAKWEDNHLGYFEALHLYVRTYYGDWKINEVSGKAFDYYLGQMEKYWKNDNLYFESMCGLTLLRNNKTSIARLIGKSIDQRLIKNPQLGAYWKNNMYAYMWYQLPIEAHCIGMEFLNELGSDAALLDELKIWLLRNKQTTHWPSSKSTVNAVYSLLSTGDAWQNEQSPVKFILGNDLVNFDQLFAGSSYGKKVFPKQAIKKEYSKALLKNENNSIAWGALHLQYFEDIDKISGSVAGSMNLVKEIYLKTILHSGVHLEKIKEGQLFKLGDRCIIRLIIKSDRPMEYVHLKDHLAAGLTASEAISGYRNQGKLWYYQSPRDLSTDFFISYLPAGTHVIEYECLASHVGAFSNGISSVQCMYAPEFAARSKGSKIILSEK